MSTVKLPRPVPLPEPDTTNTVTTLWDEPAWSDAELAHAMQGVRDRLSGIRVAYTPSPAAWPQSLAGTWEPEEPSWWPVAIDSSDWWSPQEWPGQRVLVIVARYDDEVLAHIDVARAREIATHDPALADAVVVYLPSAGQPIAPGAKAAIIAAVESGMPVTFRRLDRR